MLMLLSNLKTKHPFTVVLTTQVSLDLDLFGTKHNVFAFLHFFMYSFCYSTAKSPPVDTFTITHYIPSYGPVCTHFDLFRFTVTLQLACQTSEMLSHNRFSRTTENTCAPVRAISERDCVGKRPLF